MKRSDLKLTLPDHIPMTPEIQEWLDTCRNIMVDRCGDEFDKAMEEVSIGVYKQMLFGIPYKPDIEKMAQKIVDRSGE